MPQLEITEEDKKDSRTHLILDSANQFYDSLTEKMQFVEPIVRPSSPINELTLKLDNHFYLDLLFWNTRDPIVRFKFSTNISCNKHSATAHAVLALPLHLLMQPYGMYATVEEMAQGNPRFNPHAKDYISLYGVYDSERFNLAKKAISFTADFVEFYNHSRTSPMSSARGVKVPELHL